MITVKSSGSTDRTSKFLNSLQRGDAFALLEKAGAEGAALLASATPVESGLTADSWTYEVKRFRRRYVIIWHNTNVISGIPVAMLIQYGHGTRGGTWVSGRDYINPVIRPLFDRIADDVWNGVTSG
jgi:hydrogenase maturation factor